MLIHSIGMIQEAAVQLARESGAELYVFIRNRAEKDVLAELYQLPNDRIISEASFRIA